MLGEHGQIKSMTTDQQDQALRFFNMTAKEWRRKAEGAIASKVNVVAERNATVLRVAAERATAGKPVTAFLDIGCGTGELVIAMAERCRKALGIDFASEMIALCDQTRGERRLDNAGFATGSIFEHAFGGQTFDIISAMGFIEYVSVSELEKLAALCHRLLRPGGCLLVGSRNRLFNIFSLSAYTEMELDLETVTSLLRESMALAGIERPDAAIAACRAMPGSYPPVSSHPITGIGVDTRHQYAPSELIRMFESRGLAARGLFPIHFHGLCVPAAKTHRTLYVDIAAAINALAPDDHRLVPQASSFVLHFGKA
jgi:2-polyprenyl-3-methyl-5-hydroxy-6-metoxy-1,4-benzoquinol methylase